MRSSLRRRSDFEKVYDEGVKRVGRFLVLYMLPATEMATAVVASRKVGNAVQRNRAKRLLREAISREITGKPGAAPQIIERVFPTHPEAKASSHQAQGLWIVAIARQRILTAKSADVRDELMGLLRN